MRALKIEYSVGPEYVTIDGTVDDAKEVLSDIYGEDATFTDITDESPIDLNKLLDLLHEHGYGPAEIAVIYDCIRDNYENCVQ